MTHGNTDARTVKKIFVWAHHVAGMPGLTERNDAKC